MKGFIGMLTVVALCSPAFAKAPAKKKAVQEQAVEDPFGDFLASDSFCADRLDSRADCAVQCRTFHEVYRTGSTTRPDLVAYPLTVAKTLNVRLRLQGKILRKVSENEYLGAYAEERYDGPHLTGGYFLLETTSSKITGPGWVKVWAASFSPEMVLMSNGFEEEVDAYREYDFAGDAKFILEDNPPEKKKVAARRALFFLYSNCAK